VFDTHLALADMARQIRHCRQDAGLTLQQLATRSRVAASTIHKVEAGQMVPTLSVLLKIARGLERRPDELVRDEATLEAGGGTWRAESPAEARHEATNGCGRAPSYERGVGVWRIDLAPDQCLPSLTLDPTQRAIVWVEKGALRLLSGERLLDLDAGDCIEIGGELQIQSADSQPDRACVTLFVSPPGKLDRDLGAPMGVRSA
jgi:transcriptional regulator with XRE-family HTH domain